MMMIDLPSGWHTLAEGNLTEANAEMKNRLHLDDLVDEYETRIESIRRELSETRWFFHRLRLKSELHKMISELDDLRYQQKHWYHDITINL